MKRTRPGDDHYGLACWSSPGRTVWLRVKSHSTSGFPLPACHFTSRICRSKSWDEFATPDAPYMDFVITVCDQAAGEVCPIWPSKPMTAHWGFEDPAAFEGSDEDKRKVFSKVYRQILGRVSQFVNLPLNVLDSNVIQHELRGIGERPAEGPNEQH